MWSLDTYWFDVSLATGLLSIGIVCLGHFEEHKPLWRRLTKLVLGVALIVGISVFFGRTWMYAFFGFVAIGLLAIHGWWLPKNGVNGWTAEPRARYYELRGLDSKGRKLKKV